MAGRPKGTKMMDIPGRGRVLCWVQTGLPVRKTPKGTPADPPETPTLEALNARMAALEGLKDQVHSLRVKTQALEELARGLPKEYAAAEKRLGAGNKEILQELEKQQTTLEAKLLSLQEDLADLKQANLPLEVLKLMHSALFETSSRYRAFLKGAPRLPRWADDRETLET